MVSGRGLKGKAREREGGPKRSTHRHEAGNVRNKMRALLTKVECYKKQKQTKWDNRQSSNKTSKDSAKQKYEVQIKSKVQIKRQKCKTQVQKTHTMGNWEQTGAGA